MCYILILLYISSLGYISCSMLNAWVDHENIISLYAAFQEAGNVVMVQVRAQ